MATGIPIRSRPVTFPRRVMPICGALGAIRASVSSGEIIRCVPRLNNFRTEPSSPSARPTMFEDCTDYGNAREVSCGCNEIIFRFPSGAVSFVLISSPIRMRRRHRLRRSWSRSEQKPTAPCHLHPARVFSNAPPRAYRPSAILRTRLRLGKSRHFRHQAEAQLHPIWKAIVRTGLVSTLAASVDPPGHSR